MSTGSMLTVFLTNAFLLLAMTSTVILVLGMRGSASFRRVGFHTLVSGIVLVNLGTLLQVLRFGADLGYWPVVADPNTMVRIANTLFFAPGVAAVSIGVVLWGRYLRANDLDQQAISELQSFNAELADRFNSVSSAGLIWIWETNAENRFTFMSDVVEEVTGHAATEYIGARRQDLSWTRISEQELHRVSTAMAAREPFLDLRYTMVRPDGTEREIAVSGTPRFDANGTYQGYRGVGRDVTTETLTAHALEVVSQGLFNTVGEDYLQGLAERLSRSAGFDFVLIGQLAEDDAGAIEVIAGFGDGEPRRGFRYDLSVSPCQEVVGRDAYCHPQGVATAYPDDRPLTDNGIEGYIGVPLVTREGKPLGLIACLSRAPIAHPATSQTLIEAFADRAALEIERRRIEAELRREGAQLREAQALGRMGHYFSSVDGRRVEWSETLHDITGIAHTPRNILEFWALAHPDDRDRWMAARLDGIINGQSYRIEVRFIRPDGRQIWLFVSGAPILTEDGTVSGVLGIVQDITERKQIEEALESARRETLSALDELRGIVQSIPIPLVVHDSALRRQISNQSYRDLIGYTEEELAELPTLADLLRNEIEVRKSFGDVDADAVLNARLEEMTRGGDWHRSEHWPDRGLDIDRYVTRLPSQGWMITLIDTTPLVQARDRLEALNRSLEALVEERTRELAASEQRYRGIASISSDHLWEADASLALVRLAGGDAEGWSDSAPEIGRPVLEVFASEMTETEEAKQVAGALRRGESFRNLPLARKRAGEVQHLLISAVPNRLDGQFVGYFGTATDVTSLRAAQTELMEADRLASLGRLVAGVAHDVNTPLGNAVLVGSTLRELVVDQQRKLESNRLNRADFTQFVGSATKAADLLLSNLDRAASLIQNFKQVAVDQTSENRREFDLADQVTRIASTLQPILRKSTVQLEVIAPADIAMNSFPGALAQVLTNLIENAVRHAFDGERQAEPLIVIEVRPRGADQVEISVRDNGAGIPEAIQSRVFEPFFTTKINSGGSGLGMTIVSNIVRGILGGTLELRSTMRVGTTITMILPRTAPGS